MTLVSWGPPLDWGHMSRATQDPGRGRAKGRASQGKKCQGLRLSCQSTCCRQGAAGQQLWLEG